MTIKSFHYLCFLLFPLFLQSCVQTIHKIPETKEDYAYYGDEYKSAIEAIKYCQSTIDKGDSQKVTYYKTLRDKVKDGLQYSDKPYPIPVTKWSFDEDEHRGSTIGLSLRLCDANYKTQLKQAKEQDAANNVISEINSLTSNKALREYLAKEYNSWSDTRDTSADKLQKTKAKHKYCMYSYPEKEGLYTCDIYRNTLSEGGMLDSNVQNILDNNKTKYTKQIQGLKKQENTLYDYDSQVSDLQGKMRLIENQETDLKYIKYSHNNDYLDWYCMHRSRSAIIATNVCDSSKAYQKRLKEEGELWRAVQKMQ